MKYRIDDGLSHPLPFAVLAVMVLELLHLFTGLAAARLGAHIALGALAVTAIPRLGLREGYLLTLSAVLAVLVWTTVPDPADKLRAALDQGVFLAAFILMLSLIQEAAMTSRSVTEVGLYLAGQPGGRRFFGIFGGSMVMSVVFNMATITLLAPLIRRAAEEASEDPRTPVRERRQLNALVRGFAWQVVWSPTAVAPLAFFGLVGGIDRWSWIWIAFWISMLMMVIGWAEDRWHWRHLRPASISRPAMPKGSLLRFTAVALGLAALTGGVMLASGLAVPPALMAASPVLMLIWLITQRGDLAARLGRIATDGLPRSAPMGVTLGCAGFVGIAGAALVPSEAIADAIGLDQVTPWVFLMGCTIGVVAMAQFALSPVMMAVFFGAVLGALPSLPADPTITAVAVSCGWAIAATFSPFASGPILIARVSGRSGATLTYGWNTLYSFLTLAALGLVYAMLI